MTKKHVNKTEVKFGIGVFQMVCINESLIFLSKVWYGSEQYERISWIVQVYTTDEIQRMT